MAKDVTYPELSQRARDFLMSVVHRGSNVTVPAGIADEVVEIRKWLSAQGTVDPSLN